MPRISTRSYHQPNAHRCSLFKRMSYINRSFNGEKKLKANVQMVYVLSKPETRAQARKREELARKIRLTGLQTHVCSVHGPLPINSFLLQKTRKGDWQLLNKCKSCIKTQRKAKVTHGSTKGHQGTKKKMSIADSPKLKASRKKTLQLLKDGLSDGYIKKLLGSTIKGLNKKQLASAIMIKRDQVLAYRLKAERNANHPKGAESARGEQYRFELRDYYVRRLIRKAVDYDGHEITDQEIAAKKRLLLDIRAGLVEKKSGPTAGTKPDPKAKRDNNRMYMANAAINLTDNYLRSRIKRSKNYNGQQISKQDLARKKAEILNLRARQTNGDTKLRRPRQHR